MKRDFGALDRTVPFDLLVIGGGIYGAWVAYDAALRGMSVALLERDDWAAATSSSSSKLIHGGLRYLERYHFGLVRKSLRERRRLAELAPHQVCPLRFVIPTYRGDRVGRVRLAIGLALYDLLAGRGRDGEAHRTLGRDEVLAASGFLDPGGLTGGFEYADSVMDDARMALEIVAGASSAGAIAVNHAPAERLLLRDGSAAGAVVRDRESGQSLEVRADLTVNCAGPWAAGLLPEPRRRGARVRFQKGVHLVLPSLGVDHAMLVMAHADGRPYFLIPWYGRTLLGTTDTVYHGEPGAASVERADARYLLDDAARVLGERRWKEVDVLGSYAGLRTLRDDASASPAAASREWVLLEPMPGMLMPVGGKYTAARADAERIVDGAVARLGRGRPGSATAERPFPWRPPGEFAGWLAQAVRDGVAAGLDEAAAACAARRFGSRAAEIHRLAAGSPELAARIHPELPFCRAEIVYAVRHEMARTLDDVLRRRVPLSILARPDRGRFEDAAALAGTELGWTEERRRGEVDGLLRQGGHG